MKVSNINSLKNVFMASLCISIYVAPLCLIADNPIVSHIYTADPSAHVFNDTLYVYPSHDQDQSNWYNMVDYHVLSTVDGDTWKDHGVALHVDDVPWASEYMWAPDCAYKDGTYYFYFPARDMEGEFRIGVATSDSPVGPFIPEEEPIAGSFSMDPAVFVDDDGQAYMVFGGQGHGGADTAWGVKLKSNMKEFDGEPQAIEGLTYWFEGSWVHKHNGLYYMSYSAGSNYPTGASSPILYATATSPLGPYTYQGLIGDPTSGWTDHNSIVEYNNQWYFFHQSSDLSGGISSRRCVEAEYLHYNNDGTIRKIVRTSRGIGSYDGLASIEAENYSNMQGLVKEECSDGGFNMGYIDNGEWIEFKNVEFGGAVVGSFTANVASDGDGGILEVRVGSVDGDLIGSCVVGNTGGWQEWVDVSCDISLQSYTQDIYLKFVGEGSDLFNLNKFSFEKEVDVEFFIGSEEVAFELVAPSVVATGHLELAYEGSESVDVSVSISHESHEGAFRLVNTTPMILTEPLPANTVLEFEFDNSSIGLMDGEAATGLVMIAWSVNGFTEPIEFALPIRVEYKAVDGRPILWDFGQSSEGANIPSTVADFVAAGVSEDLSGVSVANVEAAQSMEHDQVTVELTSMGGFFIPDAAYSGAGSSLMKEYIWHRGDSDIIISGLRSKLYPNTEYSLYLWGKGDEAAQTATFSFEGTSITTSTDDVFTSDASNFMAKFSFITNATVADTLTVGWSRNSTFTAFSGFVIVPKDYTDPDMSEISVGIVPVGSKMALSFATSIGASYGVQVGNDLANPTAWPKLKSGISGNGGVMTVTLPMSESNVAQFYRVYLED